MSKASKQIDGMKRLANELDDFEDYKKRLLSEYGVDWNNPNSDTDNSFIKGIWDGARHNKNDKIGDEDESI